MPIALAEIFFHMVLIGGKDVYKTVVKAPSLIVRGKYFFPKVIGRLIF